MAALTLMGAHAVAAPGGVNVAHRAAGRGDGRGAATARPVAMKPPRGRRLVRPVTASPLRRPRPSVRRRLSIESSFSTRTCHGRSTGDL